MKSLIFAAAFSVLFFHHAEATQTPEWSLDLTTIEDLSNYNISQRQCRAFVDGSVALIFSSTNSGPSLILLLDEEGNKLYSTTLSPTEFGFVIFSGYAHTANRFCISPGYPSMRLYENKDGTYDYTDFDAINVNNGGDGGHVPNDIYTMSGAVLSKYTFDNISPLLAPTTSGSSNSNYIVSWDSKAGVQYQIEKSTDLSSWEEIGIPITGNGDTLSWSTPLISTSAFYRVIIK